MIAKTVTMSFHKTGRFISPFFRPQPRSQLGAGPAAGKGSLTRLRPCRRRVSRVCRKAGRSPSFGAPPRRCSTHVEITRADSHCSKKKCSGNYRGGTTCRPLPPHLRVRAGRRSSAASGYRRRGKANWLTPLEISFFTRQPCWRIERLLLEMSRNIMNTNNNTDAAAASTPGPGNVG